MRDFVSLFIHLIVTVVRLGLPGGLRSVVAESVLCLRAYHRRFVCAFHEPGARSTFGHRPAAFHSSRMVKKLERLENSVA
jgi:hypothetical protein